MNRSARIIVISDLFQVLLHLWGDYNRGWHWDEGDSGITTPVVFKTIRYSRRVQLWDRQALIIMDLTTLALRHGRRCLPRV